MRTLVWFRGKDLRVRDHVPLVTASRAGEVVPLFVLDPYFFARERAAELPNRIRFLLASLAELEGEIERLGSRLVVVAGRSVDVVPRVAEAYAVDRVVAHAWTEPVGRERDARVSAALGGVPFELVEGETLARHGEVLTKADQPFSVFTPFVRAFAKVVRPGRPIPAPRALPPLPRLPRGRTVDTVLVPTAADLGLDERPAILSGGAKAAHARLAAFLEGPARDYATGRDALGRAGTSRLSQDLKFGTLSVRAVWRAAEDALEDHPEAWAAFKNELLWRDFAYHVLWFSPRVLGEPFRPEWRGFPYRRDEHAWRAWVLGQTGYPIVDASARQLLAEGFVHNRARMISASFLCKHLLLDFRAGEAHYLKYLTDGDWASNDLGWQWSAGCGVDAQPWFRVFNPLLQGKRFDPDGAYVRRWVPELRGLSTRFLHEPSLAPAAELARAGVELGLTYPRPIVQHSVARARFMTAAEGFLARKRSGARPPE